MEKNSVIFDKKFSIVENKSFRYYRRGRSNQPKKDEIIFILRVSGGIFQIFPDCIIFSAGNCIIW